MEVLKIGWYHLGDVLGYHPVLAAGYSITCRV